MALRRRCLRAGLHRSDQGCTYAAKKIKVDVNRIRSFYLHKHK